MQPDFEALACAVGEIWDRSRPSEGIQAAAQVLREAFEAQLAEVRADVTLWQAKCQMEADERRRELTALQAREAEHLATIARLREALEPFAAMAPYFDDTDERRDAIYCGGSPGLRCAVTQSDYHRARTALNGESDHG